MEPQRASVPAGGRTARRHPDAHLRRSQPRAGGRRRPGRLLPRAGGVAIPRRSGEPIGVAPGYCEASRPRRAAAEANGATASPPSWGGGSKPTGAPPPVLEELFERARHQGRSASHDVLLLPSSAARGGAGRAHASHPVRLRCGRDRRRLRRHAPRRSQKRIGRAKRVLAGLEAVVRDRGRRRLRRAPAGRPPRALPAVQRGLPRRLAESTVRPSSARRRCDLRLLLEHPRG